MELIILGNLVFIGAVLFYLFKKDERDLRQRDNIIKMFENSVQNILDQTEANSEKFYDLTQKMQVSHFNNLEKHTGKILKLFTQPLPQSDKVEKLDSSYLNEIEKEETQEDPFTEDNRIPIVEGLKVQFEGEENVYPMDITN